MLSDKNRFEAAQERAAQEERRRILQDNRKMKRQCAVETRRKIIIGGIVVKYFPDIVNLQPKWRQTDTDVEFVKLEEFIYMIANDPKYSTIFREMILQKI